MSNIGDTTPPASWYEIVQQPELEVRMADLNRLSMAAASIKRIAAEVFADGYTADEFILAQERQSLQMHFERFTMAHDTIVDVAQEGDVAAHTGLWNSIEGSFKKALATIRRLEAAHIAVTPEDGEGTVITARSMIARNEMKLDPLKIPEFDGTLGNWLAFKDTFETLVHEHDYPEPYKLGKLRAAVRGDAVALVGGLYSGGYDEVWNALKKRYDNPKQLADIHVSRLLHLPPATQESSSQLLAIVDSVRASLRALRVMKLPVDQWDAFAVFLVNSKLPMTTQQAWGMTTTTEIPSLDALLTFLETRAHSIGNLTATAQEAQASPSQRRTAQHQPSTSRLVKTNLATTSPDNCAYCNEQHRITRCSKLLEMPAGERFGKLKHSNLCFNCLRPGHSTKTCQSGGCRKCGQKHNTLLCRNDPAPAVSTNNASNGAASPSTVATPTTPAVMAPAGQPPRNHPSTS